jgi:hypothetical protein
LTDAGRITERCAPDEAQDHLHTSDHRHLALLKTKMKQAQEIPAPCSSVALALANPSPGWVGGGG